MLIAQTVGVDEKPSFVLVLAIILMATLPISWVLVEWLYDTFPETMEELDESERKRAAEPQEFDLGRALIALGVVFGAVGLVWADLTWTNWRRQRKQK